MNRYCLRLSNDVPNAGTFRTAISIGSPNQWDMVNDICICAAGSYDFIPLNRNVLRQALLQNPEWTKQLLGIEVKDATIKEDIQPEKKVLKKGGAKK
jgi:hypothetical protein